MRQFCYSVTDLQKTLQATGGQQHLFVPVLTLTVCTENTGCSSIFQNVTTLTNICIKTNKMHKILVIRLYFPLNAVHVSGDISPSSGATFISCTSHLVYTGICRYFRYVWYRHIPVYAGICPYVWLLYVYSHTTARRTGIYRHIPNTIYSL